MSQVRQKYSFFTMWPNPHPGTQRPMGSLTLAVMWRHCRLSSGDMGQEQHSSWGQRHDSCHLNCPLHCASLEERVP